jgi:hypothetical protein
MMATRLWMFLSALLLIVAAVFLWRNNLSAAFVTATLGAAAWFLSYRARLRGKLAESENSIKETGNQDVDQH